MLITGATGFAGSFLFEWYLARGWTVVGTCNPSSNRQADRPLHGRMYPVDLRDAAATASLVRSVRPDVIQHLAAQSSVAVSLAKPLSTLHDNAAIQYSVLEAVVNACPGARVVTVGSCDEYGTVEPSENPVTESQELRPANPYALSKVMQDLMARQYAENHALDIVRVRPFLQIGPRRSDRFVAGSFARQAAEIALGGREPVIRVGNIDLERDFTDVRDVAQAYAMLAQSGLRGQVYNLASGTAHTLREMLSIMLETAGVRAAIEHDAALGRSPEAPLLLGDASRLRERTGWEPRIPFVTSVRDTLAYWQERVGASMAQERNT